MPDLTFTEFTDLLLARLYEAEKTEGAMVFIALRPLAADLKQNVSEGWVRQAATYLEQQGLVDAVQGHGGGQEAVQAMLTAEGRMFVERESGTGVIRQYHMNPTNYVFIAGGSGHQVVVGQQGQISQTMTNAQTQVFQLLDQLEADIDNSGNIPEDDKDDLRADVATARSQLKKRKPNIDAVVSVLQPLGQVAALGATVVQILKALGVA